MNACTCEAEVKSRNDNNDRPFKCERPTAPAGSLPECQTSCDYNAKVYGSTEGLPTQQTAETAETASALSAAMPSMSFLGRVLAGGLLLTIAN